MTPGPQSPPDRDWMLQALMVARSASAEDGRPHPKVGALLVREGSVLELAYRGELAPGEHAEFTLLQRKLATEDLRGTSLFTTLEPCTSRNHPKRPCADWIVDRGIGTVYIGMLDANPLVYGQGVAKLRNAGITVDVFPADLRDMLRQDNGVFIEQFRASPDLAGVASFNFTHNDGRYTIGHGDLTFRTRWSNASNSAIHVYTDGTGLRRLGLAIGARTFADIKDASAYDMTSRVRTPHEGEFVVLQNGGGYFAALQVVDVQARSHGDPRDSVRIQYRINTDGSARFDT